VKPPFRWAFILLSAAVVCSPSAAPHSPAVEGAPLYVAERGDSKVYILGGCGAQTDTWLSGQITNALAESRDVWRELPTANIDAAGIAYSDKLGSVPHGSLFDILDKEEAKRVLDAAQKLGIARERLAPMKVWYAARILTFASYAQSARPVGQAKDPELRLSEMAARQGKPTRSESPDWNEFSRFFDRMPERIQKQYMAYSLDDIENGPEKAQAGDSACGRGDPSYFEKSALEFSRRAIQNFTSI
jgi:uncharacterized protein YbaP (TraB family)